MIKYLIFVLIMVGVISFFWHDEIRNFVNKWQNQAIEQGPGLIKQGNQAAQDIWNNYAKEQTDKYVALLTAEGKKKIDQWLKDNKLNQYGDKEGVNYLGGTPLFNESTGVTIDRYVYLIKRFPELVDQLKLNQFLNK